MRKESRRSAAPIVLAVAALAAAIGLLAASSPSAPQAKPPAAADRDAVGDKELARAGDPTFESVAGYFPAMKKPREIVGVKHHPHDIGVAPDGSLELSDDVDAKGSPVAFFEVGKPAVRFGSGPAGCSKALAQGRLPIVLARFEGDGVRYEETIFGYSEGLSPDADLWAYVALEAKTGSPAPRTIDVRLRFAPPTGANAGRSWPMTIGADRAGTVFLKIPFDLGKAAVQEVSGKEFAAALQLVEDFWSRDAGSGTVLRTPEGRIDDARQAWLAYASLDVDQRQGVLEPHDGAGFYEEIFGYSAALYPEALDLWGRPDEARRVLDSLLTFQAPDGLFTQNFGLPDPGTLLCALAGHYAYTADGAWLRGVAPRMVKMADWIIARRREATAKGRGAGAATFGLIKYRPYCDYHDPVYDYFGDTYCAVGLERAARALKAIGLNDEAQRIAGEAAAYRRDILASMDAAAFDLEGRKVLPMEPETRRILKDSKNRGGGYYGLVASCMLESELLPAADPRAAMVMDFMVNKGGLRLGMCEFDGGVDHAYTYGYWLGQLKLDKVKPVILGLYGSLAYGMSRDTFAGVEVTHYLTGDNEPTLPHLYSCTQQLRLLRMMLLREDGDDLWIGQAAPRPWLMAGRRIELAGAPTAFGPVSFSYESRADRGEILADVSAPARNLPGKMRIRFRHPEGKPIVSATVNGSPVTTFSGETLTIAAPRGELKIRVGYTK